MECTLYSAGSYNNRNINCNKRRPSRPFFVKPYTSERKEKLKNHHNSVKEVLENWSNVKPCLLDSKDSLYTTCIPLYLNVSKELKLADQYEEAIQHLKSSKQYENAYKAYTQISELEARHNQDVSNFMNNAENRIKMLIEKDEEISLKLNSSLYREELRKLRESSFEFRISIDERMGYYLSNIFDHFRKQAINRQNNILRIEDNFKESVYNCPILFRSDSPDKLIAMSIIGNKRRLEKLKKLIEGEGEETIHRLGEFEQNIDKMRELLYDFHSSIQEISHNIPTLGLKGQCKIEHELSFRSMFINGAKSHFFQYR